MKIFTTVFPYFFFMFLSTQVWTGESVCPPFGTKVEFHQANEVYNFVSSQTVEKDEFETTASFEKRRDEMNAKLAGSPVMVIKNNWYFSDFGGDGSPKYDADNERFVVDGFICEKYDKEGRMLLPRPDCSTEFSSKFICSDERFSPFTDAGFSCMADIKKKELGQYEAQNAYGASVAVEKFATIHHEVLWNLTPGENKLSYNGKPIYIEVPLEKAKKLKDELQIGFVVKLQEPFFSSDVRQSPPTRDYPVDMLMSIKQIIVELLCVVVTDEKNQVLKAFEPSK